MLVAGTPDLAFHIFTDTIKTDRWMGKVTLDYFVNDDVLLYGTISNGFKSGGFNGANSNSTRQLEPIRPEILTSYEIGVKSTLADGTLQLNGAAFFYDYEDKQEQEAAVTFVGNISGLGNVDESEITGAEIDLQWVPGDGWNINLGVAFLDSEITEWVTVDRNLSSWPDNIVPVDAAEIGAELPMAPNLQYSALVMKTWTVNDRVIDAMVVGASCCGAATLRTSIITRQLTAAAMRVSFVSPACRAPMVSHWTTTSVRTKRQQ
jgi:iron complex outermembrane receptor protein